MKLTASEIEFLQAVYRGTRLPLADRKQDRVRQRVRKMRLAEVVMNPRRWQLTDAGRAALRNNWRAE